MLHVLHLVPTGFSYKTRSFPLPGRLCSTRDSSMRAGVAIPVSVAGFTAPDTSRPLPVLQPSNLYSAQDLLASSLNLTNTQALQLLIAQPALLYDLTPDNIR
jgi:hypothetical protein